MAKMKQEVKIGILAVITIVVFVWGYNFMKGKNILNSAKSYTVVYDRVNGLEESNAVLISGYKVGLVNKIRFASDQSGKLVVTLLIEENFDIPKNTVARIYSSDLMGTRSVALILGDSEEICESGDTLFPEVEGTLQEQVSVEMLPLKNKAENLMLSIDSVLAVIQVTFDEGFREDFSASFEHIRDAIGNLKRSAYALDTLLTNEDGRFVNILANVESISGNLKKNNEELSLLFKNMATISDSIAQSQLRSTIDNLDKTLANLDITLTRINNGEGTVGMLVADDSLYINLENTTNSLNELLKDFKENPKRYINVSVFGGRSK
jgi:phospholipid/cholesterol/gamma-HCH transport system substrate-binding protein